MAKARETKKHRQWAYYAALEQRLPTGEAIAITIHVHAKPKGPLPDTDNAIAACKAYLDGIADAMRVNDRTFDAPQVVFAKGRTGQFIVQVDTL